LKGKGFNEISIVIISVLIAVFVSLSSVGQLLDLKIYDIFSMVKPKPKEWDKIVYVNIDDQSLDIIGRWPWPRYEIAKGVKVLKEFGVEKILLDIEFIEPSRDVLDYDFYDYLVKTGKLSVSLSSVKTELIVQPDKILTEAILEGSTNVYLACRGVEQTKKNRTVIEEAEYKELAFITNMFFIPLKDKALTNSIPFDPYMEIPAFPIYLGAKDLGFTTSSRDIDGSLRRIHLFRRYKDFLVPQLALPIILDELDVDRSKIEIKPGNYVKLVTKDGKKISIPIDNQGQMILNWTKKWSDVPFGINGAHISFSDLIDYYDTKRFVEDYLPLLKNEKADKELKLYIETAMQKLRLLTEKLSVLKGKITITGLTAESSTDVGAITIDPNAPLSLLQANLINTIYHRVFLRDLPFIWDLIIALFIAFLILLISLRITSALKETIASVFILIGVLVIEYLALSLFGMIMNYILILMATIICVIGLIANKFVLYDRQKNYIKKAFMQYLSPEVVQELIVNPEFLKLGGERREITAFFSDVAGFTSISEKLEPEEVVNLLNEYLTAMTNIILKYGGTVDKYEGDAIVAFFGAPIPHPDHAIRCCNAALDMQKALIGLREKWKKEGLPEIKARIGINTGPAIIGNMGSEQKMNYTMMGDTVNTASRLEGANKAYGTYTMISEFAYKELNNEFVIRKLDLLKVVGKAKPIDVYELVCRKSEVLPEQLEMLEKYNVALNEYRSRNWDKAFSLFRDIVKKYDDPPSKTYYDRCLKYKRTPPPEDWDGVFVLTSK